MRWFDRTVSYLVLGTMYATVAGLALCAILVLVVMPICLVLGIEVPHWQGADQDGRWTWGDF